MSLFFDLNVVKTAIISMFHSKTSLLLQILLNPTHTAFCMKYNCYFLRHLVLKQRIESICWEPKFFTANFD